jgi:cellulose biosynthesis protein BcsQ
MLTLLHQAERINSKLAGLEKDEEIIDYRVFLELNMEIDVYLVISVQSQKDSPAIQEIQQYFENLAKAYRINWEIFDEDEVKEDPALENIFIDDNESKLDLGLKYRFHSLLETQNNLSNNNLSICPVVTFYSYKGGMGRTTSLCSYALNAALNEKKKVVIIDCDFEAPGYLNFFRLANDLRILSGETNGVVEYFLDRDFSKSQSLNIDNYYIRLNKDSYPNYPNQKELEGLDNIYIFPAGNLSENFINTGENEETTHRDHYLQGLARLDLSSQDKIINGFKNLLEEIDRTIKPDLILIDSRTGFNDIFGTTALVFSKAIVALFGSSQQTKPGLYFLLNKFYQTFYSNDNSNNVKLLLVNSILPEEKSLSEIFYNRFGAKVRDYLDELQDNQVIEDKYLPIMSPLRRNPLLEAIGLMEENEEEKSNYDDNYIKFVKDKKFEDYKVLFDHIDSIVFPAQQDPVGALESKDIRDSILRELKKALPSPYAEDTEIKPEQFFYRKCMDELFDKNKFIVQGFKGTGKTYLYKALKEDRYVEILKRRADLPSDEKIKFIDIISETGTGRFGNKSFDIDTLRGFEIKEEDSYYKRFWVVHTWNSVMLDASEKLNYSSKLTDKVKAIEPDTATATRFHNLINQPEQYSLIEEDLKNLDSFLENKNIKLFVLYDQLDNLVKVSPERWKKIVSPLVDYWWRSARFQNIFAKVFIRTDLISIPVAPE